MAAGEMFQAVYLGTQKTIIQLSLTHKIKKPFRIDQKYCGFK